MATPSKAARTAVPSSAPAAITSRDNHWLKQFRLALRGGLPTESGFVGVEGVRLVEEALRSDCPIEAVLFSEAGERHRERLAPLIDRPEIAIPILRTTDRLFEGVADTEHPQGVAALVKPRAASFDDLLRVSERGARRCLWCSSACKIRQRRHNSAHRVCFRRDRRGHHSLRPKRHGQSIFSKGAACFCWRALHLPILAGMSLPILLTQLRIANVRTLASCVHESVDGDKPLLAPWEVDWSEPVALLVGNEGAGLPEEVERSADARIRIPMASGVESLNAAAAAAVLFYEAARQRSGQAMKDGRL